MPLTLADIEEEATRDALRGVARDTCPYRRDDKRAAWLRGWEKARQMTRDQRDKEAVDPAEADRVRTRLEGLRAIIRGDEG